MDKRRRLPIGMDDFEKLRTNELYYVDKSGLIKELMENGGEVNLFTRPRRFGKSLNMSMLQCFFEYGREPALFDGLEIAQEKEICQKYMGKFPVIFISLKDVCGHGFDMARAMLRTVVGSEAMRFQFLSESERLTKKEKEQYEELVHIGKPGEPMFIMDDDVLARGLRTLTELLHKHYGQKVILLIDEYDVPLNKAQHAGYYEEMITLIRMLFGQALKGNPSLYFAVLTGCLRIAKESIFTGLNNLQVFSILNARYSEHFGFLDREVREMLKDWGISDKYELVKNWYDGYCFGDENIYCPWDVINYIDLLRSEPNAIPQAFWVNTSGNDIIRKLLQKADNGTKRELERLVAGDGIYKKINQELTYRDLYSSIDNLWSVLFMTGYLTKQGSVHGDLHEFVIPNFEIRQIFVSQIMEWFKEEAGKDVPRLDSFCEAFLRADSAKVEEQFNAYLLRTISIQDTKVRKVRKENFYHGILLGLLSHRTDWWVYSNAESGDGFADITVECEEKGVGIVIEVKYPDGGNLEKGCREALEQIGRMGYETKLRQDGLEHIICYGIACNRKKCKVAVAVDGGEFGGAVSKSKGNIPQETDTADN